jgi:Lon protease-like protein
MHEDIIAIFPLPNVVFFPKTNLPLHIFEPRYCEMVKETLDNGQLIGMFLLQPGWQEDYQGNPPVHAVGCAGQLVHVEYLPEGKYNILLKGLFRARALEMVQEFPYRKARVEVLPEVLSETSQILDALKISLLHDFQKLVPQDPELKELRPFSPQVEFPELVNSLAMSLPFDVESKLQLLQENNVYLRALTLQEILKKQLSAFEWTSRFTHLRPSDPNLN